MIKYHSINGKIVPVDKATLNITDLGFVRGYSAFDYFRITEGKPVFFEDHLDRFEASADFLGLAIPFSRVELAEKILALVRANEMEHGGIKLILTGGYSSNGYLPDMPNLVMLAGKKPSYPAHYYTKGIKLMAYRYTRETPDTKTTNYLIPISIRREIEEAEAQEVLYHDGTFISESARSNFFIVNQEGTIVTSNKDVLNGITRKHIIALAQKHFKIEIRPLSIKETRAAREAFLTSSTRGVMPVRQIDFWRINKGIIGNTTIQLSQLFQQYIKRYLSDAVLIK